MYPLKFEDILRPMIWGGEEISRFKQLPEVHPGIVYRSFARGKIKGKRLRS